MSEIEPQSGEGEKFQPEPTGKVKEQQEENQEKEFSPEEIEKVMEKVEDINKSGTAYSAIAQPAATIPVESDWSRKLTDIKAIFENGLLSSTPDNRFDRNRKESWLKNVRDPNLRAKGEILFNIVGRTIDPINPKSTQIASTPYFNKPNSVGLIFDLTKFKEIEVEPSIIWQETSGAHTFHADVKHQPPFKNELGQTMPSLEFGFALHDRVAPRFFKGILINEPLGLLRDQEEIWLEDLKLKKITRDDYWNLLKTNMEPEFIRGRAQEIVTQMREVYRDKPEMLVPVYDIYGNLYWPKEMSYEDVKKFVVERDRQIAEKQGESAADITSDENEN